MTFPEAGGLGQSGLHNLLELLNCADVPGGSWGPLGRPPHRVSGHPRLISGHPGAPSMRDPEGNEFDIN
jgi:hypothetical protein